MVLLQILSNLLIVPMQYHISSLHLSSVKFPGWKYGQQSTFEFYQKSVGGDTL